MELQPDAFRLGVRVSAREFSELGPLLAVLPDLSRAGCSMVQVHLDILMHHPDLHEFVAQLHEYLFSVIVHLGDCDDMIFHRDTWRKFPDLTLEGFVMHIPWHEPSGPSLLVGIARSLQSYGPLYLENDRSGHSPDDYVAVLDATQCPFCLDIGHDAATGSALVDDERITNRIGALHLHRFDSSTGLDHLPPDQAVYQMARRFLTHRNIKVILEVKSELRDLPALITDARLAINQSPDTL